MLQSKKIKDLLPLFSLLALFLAFLVCSALYVVKDFVFLPYVCGAILISHLFLFHGKYRVYAFIFYTPLSKFMIPSNIAIGSFLTWTILIYAVCLLIDFLRYKQQPTNAFLKRTLILLTFLPIMVIGTLIAVGPSGLLKTISLFLYLFMLALFCADRFASKNYTIMVGALIGGYLVSNFIAALFVYAFKDYAVPFLTRFAADVYARAWVSGQNSFRFPGLCGDPNYNGAHALIILATALVSFRRVRYWPLLVSLALAGQAFPIIGSSKSYLMGLVLLVVAAGIFFIPKRYYIATLIIAFALVSVGLLVVSNMAIGATLKRLLVMDVREGFFHALTTQRTTILERYYASFLANPFLWLVGHGGIGTALDNSYVAHAFLTSSIWNFGMVGFALFLWYFATFIPFEKLFDKNRQFAIWMPCLMILVAGLSLELERDEIIYLSFFVLCAFPNLPIPSRKAKEPVEDNSPNVLDRKANEL